MRASLVAVAMLASACGAHAGDAKLSDSTIECSWQGDAETPADADEVCAAFVEAVATADRPDVAALSIRLTAPQSARAVAYSQNGEELLALDFDVMDTELTLPRWRDFARSFASELQRR